jgi:hypothetical protein
MLLKQIENSKKEYQLGFIISHNIMKPTPLPGKSTETT